MILSRLTSLAMLSYHYKQVNRKIRFRHPKEGHFQLALYQTPAFCPTHHMNDGPHLWMSRLGSTPQAGI